MAVAAIFSLGAALCILTGLDLWISQKRWKLGFKDLNPVVQHFAKQGVKVGMMALAACNLLIIAASLLYLPGAIFLLGAKTALATLQIRSLIENGELSR